MSAGHQPTTKEAWLAFARADRPERPGELSPAEYRKLKPKERHQYDAERRRYHASLGPYAIGELARIRADIAELIDSNQYLPPDRLRPGAAIDGYPTLGKTTLLRAIGRGYERERRSDLGLYTDEGHEWWPVCHVALPKDSSIAGLNNKIAAFFHLPPRRRESQASLTSRIVEAMRHCGVELVLIDDIHFAAGSRGRRAQDLNDHIKDLMNELTATFIVAGVALEEIGFFGEGLAASKQRMAQIGGRFRHFQVLPMRTDSDVGLKDWRGLLAAVSSGLVLLSKRTGLEGKEMGEYLMRRTGGSIGHLMELIRLGAERVVALEAKQDGEPRGLTIDLMEGIQIGYSAEQRRRRTSPEKKQKAEKRKANQRAPETGETDESPNKTQGRGGDDAGTARTTDHERGNGKDGSSR